MRQASASSPVVDRGTNQRRRGPGPKPIAGIGMGIGLILAGATELAAQDQHLVIPAGFAQQTGEVWSAAPGGYAEAHYQFFDGTLVGAGSKSIDEIAFRVYYSDTLYTTHGVGKSWRNVELAIGEAKTRSVTFSANWSSAPTRVFSSSVHWPSYTGLPKTRPATWDLKFPFTTRWVYGGKQELLFDYKFRGGTMANNAAWSGNQLQFSQRLDSTRLPTPKIPANGTRSYYGNFTNTGCRDSTMAHPKYAWGDLSVQVYAKQTGDAKTANQLTAGFETWYTAPSALVVHVVTFFGIEAGTFFPASHCNRLYLDLDKPAIRFAHTASSDGTGHAKTSLGSLPFDPIFVGNSIWAQGAWHASATNYIALTRACKTTVPGQPRSRYPRHCLYYWDAVRTSGTGPYSLDYLNPIFRLRYQ